ncbi:MAG TPA: hypothetical protein VLG71_00160, partial [Candidatus Limnocylindria bacterium]|nr:hypothetical protein [Candidatus Limnocylindria bacterium]
MKHSLKLMTAFLFRDLYAQRKCITAYVFNYSIIHPLITTFTYGYLQANLLFNGNTEQTTTLLSGCAVLTLMVLTYKNNIKLLFDLCNERFIDYQISLLQP